MMLPVSLLSRVVDWQKFRDIADSVGAYLFVDMAHIAGLMPLAFTQAQWV